ncbi:LytR family transcriptional regulator, partial [Lactobacillus delbrueckii subsp. bulgaricus]
LLGIDAREKNGETVDQARSDANVLVTFNRKEKTAKMLSIPRDTRVQLAGDTTGSKTKINAAYSKGGKDETVETVENF